MLGNAGRAAAASGRPLDYDDLEHDGEPAPRALPPLCLRALQSPNPSCEHQCPGVQPDGSCLAELVRGTTGYEFEIDRDGFWCLLR